MKVNIIMLAKNRQKLTRQSVDSLYANTPRDLFNLTIVDDASEYDVMHTVLHQKTTHESNIAVIRLEHSKGITGQARNLGVYWAEKYWGRGDYLYLSDNDVYFTPGWLTNLISEMKHAEDAGFKLIGGWNHAFMQPKPGGWYRGRSIDEPIGEKNASFMFTTSHENRQFILQSHDAVTGASQLMRWSTWDKYGPLDAHAKGVCQGEDWQMCQNIIKDGGRVGSIYPRVVWNCGLTNSFGVPSVGADVVLKELQQAKMTYTDLYWE